MEKENNKDNMIEVKGKIRMLELRMKAMGNLLSKEGILTNEEVENELNDLLRGDKDETN